MDCRFFTVHTGWIQPCHLKQHFTSWKVQTVVEGGGKNLPTNTVWDCNSIFDKKQRVFQPTAEPVGTMSRQMCLVSETEGAIALKIIYSPPWVRKSLSQLPMQRWEGIFPGFLGFCPTAKWYWTLLHNLMCWTQPAPYWLQAEKMLKQMGFRSSAEYEHHPMD